VTILIPGRTCAEVLPAPRGGLLVDGRDYYRAFYQAACRAEHYLLIAAWQLDSAVHLLRGDDADGAPHPIELLPFLVSLCEARPALEIHLLAWDASSLFALEREPLQARIFQRAHPRIHYRLDAVHPMSASHHQKLVVVDRAVAFVGGMDVCFSRWDRRGHALRDPDRSNRRGRPYAPYHDIQCWLEGDAVDTLTSWFGERWRRATGQALSLPPLPATRIEVDASLPVTAERIGLARTQPRLIEPAVEAVDELRAMHVDAIAAARSLIYVENQYLSADDVHRALLARLAEPSQPPLEVVLVLPARTKALKERLSLGLRQARILRELSAAAERGGHRLGAYYTTAPGDDGEAAEVYIHAKLLCVDDRFLLVSSANLTNRSMGLDTELGVAWESASAEPSIAAARVDLLREHTGVDADEAARLFATAAGLVGRLDQRVDGGGDEPSWRLRRHPMDEVRGDLLGRLLPADLLLFDPDGPVFDDALHELTEGTGDATLVERVASAWSTARAGLARAAVSDDEPADGDDELAEPSPVDPTAQA
jgi:phospholipase D1/2